MSLFPFLPFLGGMPGISLPEKYHCTCKACGKRYSTSCYNRQTYCSVVCAKAGRIKTPTDTQPPLAPTLIEIDPDVIYDKSRRIFLESTHSQDSADSSLNMLKDVIKNIPEGSIIIPKSSIKPDSLERLHELKDRHDIFVVSPEGSISLEDYMKAAVPVG